MELPLRMERHCSNTKAVADMLAKHPKVILLGSLILFAMPQLIFPISPVKDENKWFQEWSVLAPPDGAPLLQHQSRRRNVRQAPQGAKIDGCLPRRQGVQIRKAHSETKAVAEMHSRHRKVILSARLVKITLPLLVSPISPTKDGNKWFQEWSFLAPLHGAPLFQE